LLEVIFAREGTMRGAFVAAALAAPALSIAQQAEQPPKPPYTVTGNVAVTNDYRFRGLSQTMKRAALQGGFDYAHSNGVYLGNWNSNVSSAVYPNASLEMDFYGGYKHAFGNVTADFGFIYYYYPGSLATLTNAQTGTTARREVDNKELYVGGVWKWLSLKYFHSVGDLFSIPETKNSWYLDGTASFPVTANWGGIAHVGRQKVNKWDDASYTDYRLGVTREYGGFVFGAAWVDTTAKGAVYTYTDARRTMNLGKPGFVFSLAKTL
jgi:uncharacterized protein (TIGR02001 family)